MDLTDVSRARRTPGLVVLEGFHAIKHAIRFGGEILGAWTADPEEVENLLERLAPDVHIPVEVVDTEALKKVVPRVKEAIKVKAAIGTPGTRIGAEDFRDGLDVELEHGTKYPAAHVTNNHPVLTGKIVIAHLKDALDYYRRLEIMELEIDIHKALVEKNVAKLKKYLKKLAKDKLELNKSEVAQLT